MRLFLLILLIELSAFAKPVIRINQLGFTPKEKKTAIILSEKDISNYSFRIVDKRTKRNIINGPLWSLDNPFGSYKYTYSIDFSVLRNEGEYVIMITGSDSINIRIHNEVYKEQLHLPLYYLQSQRCGDNKILGKKCHTLDVIAVDGPERGKPYDMKGGYHEPNSNIRVLLTTSYITNILLLAYKDYPDIWRDSVNMLGEMAPNKIPDILDEARWGLEWLLKLYPEKGLLYHQIGDDRSKEKVYLPYEDSTEYGWGRGRQQPVYLATGKPQGLFKITNSSFGITNIAGRTASAFALASWIWKKEQYDTQFAEELLRKAIELYEMAKVNLGVTETVPAHNVHKYQERNYYDDLELAAVELYRATQVKKYLEEAISFSKLAGDETWMGKDSVKPYEYFPFVNIGQYELFEFVDEDVKRQLRDYYRVGLLRAYYKLQDKLFSIGVPMDECVNDYALALITQIVLYKKMGGASVFDNMFKDTRDYLFGKNSVGKNYFINDVKNNKHLYKGGFLKCSINNDVNETTLNGTASLIYIFAYLSR